MADLAEAGRVTGGLRRPSLQFVGVAAVWIVTRIVLMEATLRGNESWDISLYARWAAAIGSGQFPQGDDEYQYPPGAGLLFLAVGASPEGYYRRFTFAALLCDLAVLVALLVLRHRRGGSWAGPWTWALAGAVVGPILLERFDVFPTFLAVVALALIARPAGLGAVAGLGALVKVWPGLVLLAVPRRYLAKAALSSLVTVALIGVATAVLFPGSWDFLRGQGSRGLQVEALMAFPWLLTSAATGTAPPVVGRYGSYEVDASSAGTVAMVGIVLAVIVVALILVWRIRGRLEDVPGADVVLVALLAFVVLNRVNSPQFSTWLLGVGAVALLDRRSRMLPVVAAVGIAAYLTNHSILERYMALVVADPVVVAVQALRLALLLGALVAGLVIILRGRAYRAVPLLRMPQDP